MSSTTDIEQVFSCSKIGSNGDYSWTLDREGLTDSVHITDAEAKEVLFHPTVSHGTAAVRGSGCLSRGIHFWEIEMVSKCYGTDMMIGICTDEFPYQSFTRKFVHLLGMDNNSWGISYVGCVQHNRQFRTYMPGFNQGDIISALLDMEAGTLLFAKNGQWYGPPLRGMKGKSVYPIMTSTSRRTCMRLVRSRAAVSTLRSICFSVVAGAIENDPSALEDLSLPSNVKEMLKGYLKS
jgi:SPRY domain-containing SOCS box protein 3